MYYVLYVYMYYVLYVYMYYVLYVYMYKCNSQKLTNLKQTNLEQKYLMEHNLELMACSLSGLIVAPAFQSVISTMPQTTGQNCYQNALKLLITID